ncbi:MAG: DUF6485 family protein [Desulfobacterales bacterium]
MECKKQDNPQPATAPMNPAPEKASAGECISYHLKSRALPACCFPEDAEATYDRSFEHFARLVMDRKSINGSYSINLTTPNLFNIFNWR